MVVREGVHAELDRDDVMVKETDEKIEEAGRAD